MPYGLAKHTVSKWLSWFITEIIILPVYNKEGPYSISPFTILKHKGVSLQHWEILRGSFTADAKVSRVFQKPTFPIKHVHSCCCSQGIQKCQIVDMHLKLQLSFKRIHLAFTPPVHLWLSCKKMDQQRHFNHSLFSNWLQLLLVKN